MMLPDLPSMPPGPRHFEIRPATGGYYLTQHESGVFERGRWVFKSAADLAEWLKLHLDNAAL